MARRSKQEPQDSETYVRIPTEEEVVTPKTSRWRRTKYVEVPVEEEPVAKSSGGGAGKALLSLGIIAGLAVVAKMAYDKYNDYINKAYTTGKISEVTGSTAHYTYEVDGIKYRGSVSYSSDLNPQIEESYMVEYSAEDPNNSKMLLV
ncbi:MAG: hypothetical protein WBA12_14525 [Catalinimonas sp.]